MNCVVDVFVIKYCLGLIFGWLVLVGEKKILLIFFLIYKRLKGIIWNLFKIFDILI